MEIGPDVSGSPARSPPIPGPQRRAAQDTVNINSGVRMSLTNNSCMRLEVWSSDSGTSYKPLRRQSPGVGYVVTQPNHSTWLSAYISVTLEREQRGQSQFNPGPEFRRRTWKTRTFGVKGDRCRSILPYSHRTERPRPGSECQPRHIPAPRQNGLFWCQKS